MVSRLSWVQTGSATDPCCCEECCLYPAFLNEGDPGTELYPESDLPATITLVTGGGDVTLNKQVDAGPFPYGYEYRSGDSKWNLILDASVTGWALVDTDEITPPIPYWLRQCLIGTYEEQEGVIGVPATYDINDDFTGTYTVNGVDTITRDGDGSCVWLGAKTGGGTWMLDYGITTPYTWHLSSDGPSPTADDKTAPQDGPPGTYGPETIA